MDVCWRFWMSFDIVWTIIRWHWLSFKPTPPPPPPPPAVPTMAFLLVFISWFTWHSSTLEIFFVYFGVSIWRKLSFSLASFPFSFPKFFFLDLFRQISHYLQFEVLPPTPFLVVKKWKFWILVSSSVLLLFYLYLPVNSNSELLTSYL